ncbi:hypothetical protein ERO13_A09G005600v2 [Gossypium hirsutum]|uniref:Uncharacterized protein n=1 Tax=Gossypium tomentosum TaxID=34277 RepID=A0A5D2P1H6_GOSTO|nr:hypothetical protein ERO13_A09G005600v2 [Gossypium hirsutum]TYI08510.1 hypothetical protein ES332_A09G006400v1 [Gossypium tomentosum]
MGRRKGEEGERGAVMADYSVHRRSTPPPLHQSEATRTAGTGRVYEGWVLVVRKLCWRGAWAWRQEAGAYGGLELLGLLVAARGPLCPRVCQNRA